MNDLTPDASPGHTRRTWAGLALILLAVVACAWPGMFSAPFSDDIPQLARSSRFTKWTDVFQLDAFYFFRPVKNAVFMAAAALQDQPLAWHAIGLAAYLAATLGVFRIVKLCTGADRPALIATAIWALSPACVSTAIWLSCANISFGIAFAAAAFTLHERAARSGSARWFAAAAAAYVGCLLCYEALIAVPGLLFIRDLQQGRLAINRRTITRYAVYSAIAIALLVVRAQFSAKSIGVNDYHAAFAPDTTAIHLTLSAPWFLWRHFLMWIFPFGHIELLGSYAWLRSAPLPVLVLSWLFLATLLATAALTWRRLPLVSYGLLFFVVASVPSGNFLPGFNGPINDAYVTIPSIGLALIAAAACESLIVAIRRRRRANDTGVPALAAILILLLAYRLPVCGAYFRYWSGVWCDPVKLVLLMSETRPFQFHSKGYAANLLVLRGYLEPAETLANETLKDAPWSEWSHLTLARVAGLRGDHTAAATIYQELLSRKHLPESIRNISGIELAAAMAESPEHREEAANLCRRILGSAHSDPKTHIRAVLCLADIYQKQGNPDKSRATIRRGIAIHRESGILQDALARLDTQPPANP